jgi:uncharacterized membrane protein HdeD (DUF308 family)
MANWMRGDAGEWLGALGRAWGWLLAFGIISVIAGLIAIFWPGSALLAIAVIFGAYLVVGGVFRFVDAFAIPGERGWVRGLMALLAVISFLVGLFLLRHPLFSVLILALLLGLYWMIHGVINLFAAFGHQEMPGRGWRIIGGVLSIVAGAIVFFDPGLSVLALAVILGIWLVIFGVTEVIASFALRSQSHGHSSTRTPAATT